MAVCPVCGDQVINGRCRFCGMPYRNDEAMYHLNESSREHYRHASSSVKQKMREAAVPLGDQGYAGKHPVSRAEMQAKQQQIRKEALDKMSRPAASTTVRKGKETININGKNKNVSTKKTTYSSPAGKALTGNKKKRGGLWVWILVILFVLLSNLESLPPSVRYQIFRLTHWFRNL